MGEKLTDPQRLALRRVAKDAKLFGGEVCETHVHAVVLRSLVDRGWISRHRPAGAIARRNPALGMALKLTEAGRRALEGEKP